MGSVKLGEKFLDNRDCNLGYNLGLNTKVFKMRTSRIKGQHYYNTAY